MAGSTRGPVMLPPQAPESYAEEMKNFNLPLPEQSYNRLMAEAEWTQVPATTPAREAVDGCCDHNSARASKTRSRATPREWGVPTPDSTADSGRAGPGSL